MNSTITIDWPAKSFLRELAGRISRKKHELSDRVHAGGDARCRSHGWTVTETTGRLGFGARTYRDPRFDEMHGREIVSAQIRETLSGQQRHWGY